MIAVIADNAAASNDKYVFPVLCQVIHSFLVASNNLINILARHATSISDL